MKSKRFTTTVSNPYFLTSKKIKRLIIKEANTVPQPIMLITDFDKFFRSNPFSRNPINGNSGTK